MLGYINNIYLIHSCKLKIEIINMISSKKWTTPVKVLLFVVICIVEKTY